MGCYPGTRTGDRCSRRTAILPADQGLRLCFEKREGWDHGDEDTDKELGNFFHCAPVEVVSSRSCFLRELHGEGDGNQIDCVLDEVWIGSNGGFFTVGEEGDALGAAVGIGECVETSEEAAAVGADEDQHDESNR